MSDDYKKKLPELRLQLIDAVKLFINDKLPNSSWSDAFNKLSDAIDQLISQEQGKIQEEQAQQLQPVPVSTGGTIKRTRRHRKRKVIKKYTRKDKKNNQRRKSRRIQKRKQTHKRKLGKLGKSRKSYKSRK